MWQKRRSLPVLLLGLALGGILCAPEVSASDLVRLDGCTEGVGQGVEGSTWLGLVGGGARPVKLIEDFLSHSARYQSFKPNILVAAWASGQPEESVEAIQSELSLAAESIGLSPVFGRSLRVPESQQEWDVWHSQLKKAHGVWFTGGDQNRVLDALDSQVGERTEWLNSYCRGVAWGGDECGHRNPWRVGHDR